MYCWGTPKASSPDDPWSAGRRPLEPHEEYEEGDIGSAEFLTPRILLFERDG